MTSVRTGIDLVEIARLEAVSEPIRARFLRRVFTPQELADAGGSLAYLAGRFAAKEAVAKVLTTGIGEVAWQEIEVLCGPRGEPVLRLHGAAREFASQLKLSGWSVSITHTRSYAAAVAAALSEGAETA